MWRQAQLLLALTFLVLCQFTITVLAVCECSFATEDNNNCCKWSPNLSEEEKVFFDEILHSANPQQIETEIMEGLMFYRSLVELTMAGDSDGVRELCKSGDLIRCSNEAFDFWTVAKEIDRTKHINLAKTFTIHDFIVNGGELPDSVQLSRRSGRALSKWQRAIGATPENVAVQFEKLVETVDAVFKELSKSGVPIELVKSSENGDFGEGNKLFADEDEVINPAAAEKGEERISLNNLRLMKRDVSEGELVSLKKRDGLFGALKATLVGLLRFFGGVVGTAVLFIAFILFTASLLVNAFLTTAGLLIRGLLRGMILVGGCLCGALDCLMTTATCCCVPGCFRQAYDKLVSRPSKDGVGCAVGGISAGIPNLMFGATEVVASLGFRLVGSGRHSLFSSNWDRDYFVRKRPDAIKNANVIRDQ